ncbi:hypothetical protein LOTGIDRAFT_228069 [Lottia gigantea]|uniref:PWWP domain-containing protein n=1 Tax=Lottia gigantea TaxID=225164 RepID=V4BHZ3_LOTGI|nr:hypothetical protein LOTGIDRAFT_228069 [Lottia gigantea]ESP05517.1 hypothetical protein LOTGIDRAFT_228069 [Lottia gigantea]
MENNHQIVESAAYIQEKEKKSAFKKEKTVSKKESLLNNVKEEIEKGPRISSQKRKSDSLINEISASTTRKKRKNKDSRHETCVKVDKDGSTSHSYEKIHCNSSSRLRQKPLKTDKTSSFESKVINVPSKLEKYSEAHKNGCVKSDSKWKNRKTSMNGKTIQQEAVLIDNKSSKDDYWYSKLDQRARDSYIPDCDDKVAHKKLKKLERSKDDNVVKKDIKFEKAPVVHSNGFSKSRLVSEEIKSLVVPSTPPKRTNGYDPNLCYDACDTPPLAMSQKQNGVLNEKSSPTVTDSFISVNGLSQSICSEEDDDDLPEFLTNSEEQGYTPKEDDLIWFKYRHYPFWPAKILKITKLKGRLKLRIYFFGEAQKFTVNYSKNSVLPYFHPKKDILTEKGKDTDNKVLKESFLKSIKDVTSEVMKKASVSLNSSPTEKHCFQLNSSGEESFNSITSFKDEQSEFKLNWKQRGQLSFNSKITDKMLEKCRKRKERLQERNKILVDFIKTDKVKEYLFGVYRGQIESESHQKFHTSATEQNHLRFKARSFWYLEDEEQITEVFDVLKDYYKEVSGCEINNIGYIVDVWFPEAVVYSLIKKRRLTKSKAWEIFEKPKKRSKVEEILEHQQLIRSASPESNKLKLRPPPKLKLRQTT